MNIHNKSLFGVKTPAFYLLNAAFFCFEDEDSSSVSSLALNFASFGGFSLATFKSSGWILPQK